MQGSGLKIVILEGFYTQEELVQAKQGQVEPEAVAQLMNAFFEELEQELRVELEQKVG